jgi:hypothetical protein
VAPFAGCFDNRLPPRRVARSRPLRAEGLVVYATTRRLTLEVGADSSPWLEAVVKVVHARDAAVAVKPGGDE